MAISSLRWSGRRSSESHAAENQASSRSNGAGSSNVDGLGNDAGGSSKVRSSNAASTPSLLPKW